MEESNQGGHYHWIVEPQKEKIMQRFGSVATVGALIEARSYLPEY
jgi:hypothetical protein